MENSTIVGSVNEDKSELLCGGVATGEVNKMWFGKVVVAIYVDL